MLYLVLLKHNNMDYVIELLETHKKYLERNVRDQTMTRRDMKQASLELSHINQLKRVLKLLKVKNTKL